MLSLYMMYLKSIMAIFMSEEKIDLAELVKTVHDLSEVQRVEVDYVLAI